MTNTVQVSNQKRACRAIDTSHIQTRNITLLGTAWQENFMTD